MIAIDKCVALITGSASGLGKATLQHLVTKGVRGAIAFDLKSHEFDIPENVVTVQGNVCEEKDVKEALQTCKEKFGLLNTVVNCAGIAASNRFYNFEKKEPQPFEDMRKVIETNFLGTFNVNRLAVGLIGEIPREGKDKHSKPRGVIINTSGITAFDGSIGQVVNAAASGAINSMTLPMARDLGIEGIRVVTIAPGFFKTPLLEIVAEKASEMPLCPKRLGFAEEYAYLVSTIMENPLINGTVIRLDGGVRIPF